MKRGVVLTRQPSPSPSTSISSSLHLLRLQVTFNPAGMRIAVVAPSEGVQRLLSHVLPQFLRVSLSCALIVYNISY